MPSNTNSGKKSSSFIIAIISAVAGFYVTRHYIFPPKSTAQLLTEASYAINKTLPLMVDDITRCETTFTGPGNVFNYNMTVLGVRAAGLENREELRKRAETQLAQNYRMLSEMEPMRDRGTVLHYHYSDESGAPIFDIEVDPKRLP